MMTAEREFAEPRFVNSFDGARIAYRDSGAGRPVLLIHGYIADSLANWVQTGIAQAINYALRDEFDPDDAKKMGERMAAHGDKLTGG